MQLQRKFQPSHVTRRQQDALMIMSAHGRVHKLHGAPSYTHQNSGHTRQKQFKKHQRHEPWGHGVLQDTWTGWAQTTLSSNINFTCCKCVCSLVSHD